MNNFEVVYGKPYFTEVTNIKKQYDYLNEDIETDIIIVGGGVTGAILGYYLTKAGIDCCILEKARIGYGSTSITTALLQYELDDNLSNLKEYTNYEKIIKSYKLGLNALDEIDEFINTYGNYCDYEKKDALLYTAKNIEVQELKDEYKYRKDNDIEVSFIDDNNNPYSFDLKAGVFSKNGGAVFNPYKFAHHLLEVAMTLGLKIFENTEVQEINYYEDYVEVVASYGFKVKGKKIICATGYNTKLFTDKAFGTKTIAYNIVTKPLKKIDDIYKNIVIRDNCDPYNYVRTTPDNRIIIGGEDTPFLEGRFCGNIYQEKYNILEQRLKNMFKDIPDIEIEYKYCGVFASTNDNLGYIGRDKHRKSLYYCLGYGANGILFAVLGGKMLVNLFTGKKDEDLELFNPYRNC